MTFKEWATTCLALEEVRWLRSFNDRRDIVQNQLIYFFGGKLLTEIKASDVEDFRAQRRKRGGSIPSLQTINNDHTVLKHRFNVAVRRGLLVKEHYQTWRRCAAWQPIMCFCMTVCEYTRHSRQPRRIKVYKLPFHGLRHCASTNLRRAGVDRATAMKIMGHKSEKMWKRYNAIEESDLNNAMLKLNKYHESNTLLTPASSTAAPVSATA